MLLAFSMLLMGLLFLILLMVLCLWSWLWLLMLLLLLSLAAVTGHCACKRAEGLELMLYSCKI